MTNITLHNNVLAVHNGASLSAVGAPRSVYTAKLANTLATTSNRVSTVEDISSWQVGDYVVFVSPTTNLTSAPRKTIASIIDSHTFTINSGIDTNRTLATVPEYTDHIFNLTRELQINGFTPAVRGAIRVLDSGKVDIANTEFSNWGILGDTTRDGIVFAANRDNTSTIESCALVGDFASTTNFISHYPSYRTEGPSLYISNNIVHNVDGSALKIATTTTTPMNISAVDNKFIISNVKCVGVSSTNTFVLSGNQFISSYYPATIVDFRWISSPVIQDEGYFGNRSYALSAANLIDMRLDRLTATFNDRINQQDIGVLYLTNCQNITAQSFISSDNYIYGIHFDKVYHSTFLIDSTFNRNLNHNIKINTPNSLSLSAFNITNVNASSAIRYEGISYKGSLNLNIDNVTSRYNRNGAYIEYDGNATIVSETAPTDIAFTGPTSTSSTLIEDSTTFVVVPHNTKFAHGNNEFTYEAYINLPSTTGQHFVFDLRDSTFSPNDMFLYVNNGIFTGGNNGTYWPQFGSTPTIQPNTWHHVALCRDISLFQNAAALNRSGYFTLLNDIDITAGDYTVECQVLFKSNNIGYQGIFSRNNAAGDYAASLNVILENNNTIYLHMTRAGGSWTNSVGTGIVPQINTWYHIAVTKLGNVVTIWVNGIAAASTTLASPEYNVNQSWCIGSYRNFPGGANYPLNGYMANFRIVTGVALYTGPGPFPVPTTSPAAVTGTQLLLNFENTGAPWYRDTSGLSRVVVINGNATQVNALPLVTLFVDGTKIGNSILDTFSNKSVQLTIGSQYLNSAYLNGYISQVRVNQTALYPTNPVPARVNDNYTFTTNVILTATNNKISNSVDTNLWMNNVNSTIFLTPNIVHITDNNLPAAMHGIQANNIAGHIDRNIFASCVTDAMSVSIGNRRTLVTSNTAYLITTRTVANITDGLNYFPTIFDNNVVYSEGEFDLQPGGIGLYNRGSAQILTTWPACAIIANPSQVSLPRNDTAGISFYTRDYNITHLKITYSGNISPIAFAAELYIDNTLQGSLLAGGSPAIFSIPKAKETAKFKKITIKYYKVSAAEHFDESLCIQDMKYSYDGINFEPFDFAYLYYNAAINYVYNQPSVLTTVFGGAPYFRFANVSKSNFKKFHIINTVNASIVPLYLRAVSGPVIGSYMVEPVDVLVDVPTFKAYYQDNTEKSIGIAWTDLPDINLINKKGTIQLDSSITINNQSNAPSEVLYPTAGSKYKKLKSAKKYVTVSAGNATKVYTFVRVSTTYNGTPPRLICSQHAALGVESDVVLQSYTTLPNTWQLLQGTIDASDKDGVLEFYVDCDGSAGYVAVDSWAAPI